MADEVLIKTGANSVSFADHATDFSGGTEALEVGTPIDGQLDLTGLVDAAARASAKVDLGATRAAQYSCDAIMEFSAAPTDGQTVDIYWSPSPNATAADANPGNVTGSDAAYTGDGTGSVLAGVRQMQFIGSMRVSARTGSASLQVGHVGVFSPAHRYGCLVVFNNSKGTLFTDAAEMIVALTPIVDEIQN